MVNVTIDGIKFDAPMGMTVLEVAKMLGLEIPTLCHHEGLSDWGGCRLCAVEIGTGTKTRLASACTYPIEEGLYVRTSTPRVVKARKIALELLVAQAPSSRTLQDLAAKFGLKNVRFEPKWETCIYCGLCVRMCEEQMMAKAIGFTGRGNKLKITTPFNAHSDECRKCGGCEKICPVCSMRCEGMKPDSVLCGRCLNDLQPTCLEVHGSYDCWMGLKGECGTCVKVDNKPEVKKGVKA